jgi:hypothetical protein
MVDGGKEGIDEVSMHKRESPDCRGVSRQSCFGVLQDRPNNDEKNEKTERNEGD